MQVARLGVGLENLPAVVMLPIGIISAAMPQLLKLRSHFIGAIVSGGESMSEERDVDTEKLENWKPGNQQDAECGFDCSEDKEDADCCACCW